MLFINLRVDPDPRGRCSSRQSRQTLPVMRRVNTIAKYMYGPSREFVRFKRIFILFPPAMPTRCIAAECRKTLFEMYQLTTWTYMHALQAKSASIDVTKGVGGVSPPNNFIYFLNI